MTIAGHARGKAYFDLRAKRIIYSEAVIDITMIMTYGRDSAKAKGELKVWFSRLKPERNKNRGKASGRTDVKPPMKRDPAIPDKRVGGKTPVRETPVERHTGNGRVKLAKFPVSIVPPEGWNDSGSNDGSSLVLRSRMESSLTITVKASVVTDGLTITKFRPVGRQAALAQYRRIVKDGFKMVDGKRAYFVQADRPQSGDTGFTTTFYVQTSANRYMISFVTDKKNLIRHRPIVKAVLTRTWTVSPVATATTPTPMSIPV